MISRTKIVQDLTLWHPWFAWRPVRVYAGTSNMYRWVWWEWIERKLEFRYADNIAYYRLVKK